MYGFALAFDREYMLGTLNSTNIYVKEWGVHHQDLQTLLPMQLAHICTAHSALCLLDVQVGI